MSDNNVLPVGYVLRGPELTYKIVSVLGRGGFGITYLAEATVRVGNVSARMRFAIKEHFMSGDCEREGESMRVVCSTPVRERVQNSLKDFISEAQRLHKVGVDHPNIVKINEVLEANGTAYYVMEYLEGESLRSYVKSRGPLSEDEMLAIMQPVVDAVRYLHAARMTHLDIKPDNIMLTRDEADRLRPVLIDFGLAKHYGRDGRPTSTINILGCSDGYAPMEQYAGITTFSPAADCYALGATMWFCLTGKTPPKSTTLRDGDLTRELAGKATPATQAMIGAACRVNQFDRTFPGLTAPAGATPAWHAPSTASKTTLIDERRRSLPWRAIAAAVVAALVFVGAYFVWYNHDKESDILAEANKEYANKNYVRAMELYQQIPDNVISQVRIAFMYVKGEGVSQDYSEAVKWFSKAAEKGDGMGQSALGYAYYSGYGIDKNYAEALNWFRKAAEQEIDIAQYYLGIMYAYGEGVEKDTTEALKWFHKAADQGYEDALDYIRQIESENDGVVEEIVAVDDNDVVCDTAIIAE